MSALGPISFAAPWALVGLAALPVIYLLLRVTPPSPRRRLFAPIDLLRDVEPSEETPARTPWWLTALRLVIAGLIVFGLARPVLFPPAPSTSVGPALVVVDDGWASAIDWSRRVRAAEAVLDAADARGRLAALAFTSSTLAAPPDLVLQSPRDAKRRINQHQPNPWAPDYAAAAGRIEAARLAGAVPADAEPVFISDGVDHGDAAALFEALARFADGEIVAPAAARGAILLDAPTATPAGFALTARRVQTLGPREADVVALDDDARPLGRATFAFADGEDLAQAAIDLPLALRNRVALIRLERNAGAGGAQALDATWRRPSVGLIDEAGADDRQPLLADLHYIEQALAPHAQTRRAGIDELLAWKPAALVLTDAARVAGADGDKLERYVGEGGLLIRFAGPRIAARGDALTPVRLREGGRALGGALAWDAPQPIAPFAADSPFAGLEIPDDAEIRQQVLAEPAPDLSERAWARLDDGTPIVTAAPRGRGWIILFHVTARPDWSDLPASGLFVAMLERALRYADAGAAAAAVDGAGPWRLDRRLSADARLTSPPADTPQVEAARLDASPGPDAPAGVWRRGAETRALNIGRPDAVFSALPTPPAGLTLRADEGPTARPLGGYLLLGALALFALDALILFALSGRLGGFARRWRKPAIVGATALVAAFGLAAVDPAPAKAVDDAFALDALSELRLGYVITGDSGVDAMSEAGLRGLSRQLFRRTSVEPGEPLGLNIERDEIAFAPLLYWPVSRDAAAPSDAAAAKIDAYLKAGGVIVFDTQDGGDAARGGFGAHPGLVRLVEAIDIPPLRPAPADHVLTKSFYLLREFPGRWADGEVWVEADSEGSARDGVSAVIVGNADWASAWAIDDNGRPLAGVAPGGEFQRETAYRFGINLVMYVLTGNYKADQVHVKEILERLGQ